MVFDYVFAVRQRADIPSIVRSLLRGIIYIGLFLFLLPRLFSWHDVAGLLTSSAIVSIILGLALQETLGNLFAGVAMQMSRPYLTGHWVKIGAYEGTVERADWRSMTIRTFRGDQVSFPHSFLAKMEIHNYSFPSRLHACEVQVGVHYRHPPAMVKALLIRCAQETVGVYADPQPTALLLSYHDSAVLYGVYFWIDDFGQHRHIESDLLTRIWYQFKREQIEIPYPTREFYLRPTEVSVDVVAERTRLLRRIEFLSVLVGQQQKTLAQRLSTQLFTQGETICRQGERGETFYLIKRGLVEVTAHDEHGHTAFVRTMETGEFFGEISLLTGEPRSATVTALDETEVLVICKEDMRCMLKANDTLAAHMSEVLSSRQDYLDKQLASLMQQELVNGQSRAEGGESIRREILDRILNFFSY